MKYLSNLVPCKCILIANDTKFTSLLCVFVLVCSLITCPCHEAFRPPPPLGKPQTGAPVSLHPSSLTSTASLNKKWSDARDGSRTLPHTGGVPRCIPDCGKVATTEEADLLLLRRFNSRPRLKFPHLLTTLAPRNSPSSLTSPFKKTKLGFACEKVQLDSGWDHKSCECGRLCFSLLQPTLAEHQRLSHGQETAPH